MAELFSEKGSRISIYDKSPEAVQKIVDKAAQNSNINKEYVKGYNSLKELLASSPHEQEKIIVLSLPHGRIVDFILDEIEPLTKQGDIILDCDNEEWQKTEARQKRCESASFGNGPINWMGVGVSGGYQAARRGPSLCPGGKKEVYDKVIHLLEHWACKDAKGNSCVQYMGKGGAGHHVKVKHSQRTVCYPLI